MPLFLSTLEQWFWHVWDNLWRLLGWNLVLFLVTAPLLSVGPAVSGPGPVHALWAVFVLGPLFTGTVAWVWPMTDDRSPGLAELGRRLRRVWLRATALHAAFALLVALVSLNLRFYLGEQGQALLGRTGSLLLAGFTLWIAAFVVLVWLWAQVALGEDRPQGPHTLGGALRQGARIVLFHPLLSLAHLATVALFTHLMIRSQVGLVFFWHVGLAVYLATAVAEMYCAAEAKQAEAQAKPEPEQRPTSWREILRDEAPGARGPHARRPRRSLREIFRPWEM